MLFPVFQVPWLGNGMVIALDAVTHVLISHGVAIGAFAMLVLAALLHRRAPPADAAGWDHFERRLLRFIVVVASIAGAVTGAGIWFTIGTLAPRATASMLRVFFWPWFIEWIVFVTEISLLLWIWYRHEHLSPKRRLRLGLGYLALVTSSGFLISGILAFMLTPGGWPASRRLTEAFFNPSFPPQLVVRLLLAFTLGAMIALGYAAVVRMNAPVRRHALRVFGTALAALLPALVLAGTWYVLVVPDAYLTRLTFSVLTSHLAHRPELLVAANLAGAAVLVLLAVAALRGRPRAVRWLLVPAAVVAVAGVSQFERIREFVRGPYLMPGYMYVSQVLVQEVPVTRQTGLMQGAAWASLQTADAGPHARGAFLFAQGCSGCHTLRGLNGITTRVQGRSADGIEVMVRRAHEMVSFMPPFPGTDEEARVLARYLHDLAAGRVEMASSARHRPAPAAP